MTRCLECGESFKPQERWPWSTFCGESCLSEWNEWQAAEEWRQGDFGDFKSEEEDD